MAAASSCKAMRAVAKVHIAARVQQYFPKSVVVANKTHQPCLGREQDDNLWKGIAEIKWGDVALQLGRDSSLAGDGRWFSFCQHRVCLRSNQ